MAEQRPDPSTDQRRNHYEENLDRKRERLLERADKADREGDARINRANRDASAIPMGQPILVGHHSEKRDRNFRKRIHNNYSKGFELKEKAGNLRARAASVGTAGVSSDDPDAVVKLEEQLAELEKKQEFNKAINKALRVADRTGSDEALINLGLGEALIAQLKKPDFAGRRGIPSTFSPTTARTWPGSASGSRRCAKLPTIRPASRSTATFASSTTWRKTAYRFSSPGSLRRKFARSSSRTLSDGRARRERGSAIGAMPRCGGRGVAAV